MRKKTHFAVVGAGHGGQGLAGYLVQRGYPVNLFNKSPQRIQSIVDAGGVQLSGAVEGFSPFNEVTTDPAVALKDARVVMVAVPANGHAAVARLLADHLTADHVVILNPGRTGGALEFARQLQLCGNTSPLIAEAQTFLLACRAHGPAEVTIYGIKRRVPLAALPGIYTAEVLSLINRALPQFVPAASVLETSLNNVGVIFHPAPTLLNAARIEDEQCTFEYYRAGISPAVARVLEAMDRERLAIARAFGVKAVSARRWLAKAYGARGRTLYEAVQNNRAYRGITAPDKLAHRYLAEDVPTGLVPMAALGSLAGLPTPTLSTFVNLGSAALGVDYWQQGRNLKRLGIEGLTPQEVALWVWGGGMSGGPDDVMEAG